MGFLTFLVTTQVFDHLEQVKVFKFPPNITSVYQPLDQAGIAVLKAEYKNKLLSKDDRKRLLITTLNLQVMARQLPPGCAGLDYGSPGC